ncbi:transferrin-binding protein-like solute binding protein [Ursidibacter sp. B-7004-1]
MSIMYFKKRKLSVIFPLLLTACAGKGGFDSNIIAEDQSVKPNTQGEQLPPDTGEAPKDNQYSSGYEVKIPSRNLATYDENGKKLGQEQGADYVHNNNGGRERKLVMLDKQREDIAYIDLDNRTYLVDSQFKLTEEDKKNGFNYISLGFRSPLSNNVILKQLPENNATYHTILKELNNSLYYQGSHTAKSLPRNMKVKYNGVWYFVTDARRKGHGTDFGSEVWEVGRDYGATSDREDGTHISEFDVDFSSKKLTGSLKKKSRDGQEITRYNIEADVEKNHFKGKATATTPITYKKVNTEDPIPENPLYFYENSDNVQGGFYGDNAEELVGGFSTGTPKKISTFVAFGAKRDEIAPNNLERKIDATKINVSTENHFVESNLDNYMDISKLVIDGKEFSLSAPSEYSIQECCKNSTAKNVKFGSFNKIDKDNRVNSKNSANHRIASYENLISKYYPILVKLDLVKDISLTTLGDLKTALNLENDDHEELINLLQQLDFTDPATKQALNFDEKLIKVIKNNLTEPEYAVNLFSSIGFNLTKALTTLNMSIEDLKGLEDLDEEIGDEEDEIEDIENEEDNNEEIGNEESENDDSESEELENSENENEELENEKPTLGNRALLTENRENEKNKANEEKLNTLVSYIQKHIDVNNKELISEIFNDESLEDINVNSTLKIKSNVVKNIKENHSLADNITHKDIQTAIIISTLVEKLDFNDKDVETILNSRDEDEGEEDENIPNSNIATSKVDRLISAYNRDSSILDDLINKLPTDAQKNLQVNLKNSLMPSNIDHYGEHLFIQGNRTPKNEIPTGGQFTYKGKWQGVFKQNGAEKTETSTYKYDEETNTYTKVDNGKASYTHNNNAYGSAHTDGSADFSVDFSNKTLSGSLYNSHSADSNTQKITISDGKIEGTTFSAKAYTDSNDGITLNGIRDDSKLTKIKIDKTDVSGAFYGPQAKELGGSFIVNQYDVKREQPTISDNNGNKEINQKTIINETRGAVVFGATQVESK